MDINDKTKIIHSKVSDVAKKSMNAMAQKANIKTIVGTVVGLYLLVVLNILTIIKNILMPVYKLFFASRHPIVVRTPEDRFIAANLDALGYTFASNYIEIPFGAGRSIDRPRMHYIDECTNENKQAAKETLLCLHGEPTWSFLYRKMIPIFINAGYRVVVPDMIGFGKSDKFVDMDNYNHEMHMFSIKHLINELGLGNNITLVCQDWGGLTGLSVIKDMPDRFGNIVVMNTGVPTGIDDELLRKKPLETVTNTLPFLVWRSSVALFGTWLPILTLFRRVIRFGAAESKAYAAPFPEGNYKAGVAKWPLMVPIYRDDPVTQHMVEVKSCLRIWQKPALIMFGDSDPITSHCAEEFAHLMPHAVRKTIEGASHFLQETHGEECANNIVAFLENKDI